MSDEKNEANSVKTQSHLLSESTDISLKRKELDLQESNLDQDHIPDLKDYNTLDNKLAELKEENRILRDYNKSLTEKHNNTLNAMYIHEQKMREFFGIYRVEQEERHKYQLLVEKLKHEIAELTTEIAQQENKYLKLKNQMSYRLGSRIVGIKKKGDIIGLPRKILNDYIDFKSSPAEQFVNTPHKNKSPLLEFNSYKDHVLFDGNCSIILKPQFTSIILENNFDGKIDLQLYGVKANTSVDIEVRLQALNGKCVFKIENKSSDLYQVEKGDDYVTSFKLTDEMVFPLLDILSNKGGLKISVKKLRGVPSCLTLFKSDGLTYKNVKSGKIANELEQLSETQTSTKIVIPPLKKPNAVLFEAEQLVSTAGEQVAHEFAKKYMKNKFKPALNIFDANLVLGDDERWLNYINLYLKSFGCSPIKLNKQVDKQLYYRVTADKPKDINDVTKVSIIMPAFNAENTIRSAIKSILNQTWTNIELIVINDCSEDNTWAVIKDIAGKDNRVVAVNNPANVGAYVSKNIGLKVATGQYITGHDADDWAHPQRIENHIKAINSEEVKPKASSTRMIRMEENGYFPFYLEGTFCLDGVLRVASITCMFEADFLRNTLGGWDCSRFGADSEIISRAKMVLGDEFKDYHQVSMICLNAPNSLTNNPIHGVQRGKGLSPSRKFYKDQWTEWHKSLDKDNVYLEFPHLDRKFLVPEGTEIPVKNILRVIENIKNDVGC